MSDMLDGRGDYPNPDIDDIMDQGNHYMDYYDNHDINVNRHNPHDASYDIEILAINCKSLQIECQGKQVCVPKSIVRHDFVEDDIGSSFVVDIHQPIMKSILNPWLNDNISIEELCERMGLTCSQ